MDIEQFKNWALEQDTVAKYNDGLFPGECVSLVNQYCYRVLGVPATAWGHAKDWASNPAVLIFFNKASYIQPGDIIVFGATSGNPYGHIAVALTGYSMLDQNGDLGRRVAVRPIFANIIGILRKKNISTGGGNKMIPDTDNYYWRYGIDLAVKLRGRQLSRDEFRNALVGKSDLTAIEILSDDPEAARIQQAQTLGMVAQRDNWQQQIADLLLRVDQFSKNPTQDELKAVQEQLSACKQNLQVTDEQLESFRKKQVDDTVAADTFLRRLGQIITKYLPW